MTHLSPPNATVKDKGLTQESSVLDGAVENHRTRVARDKRTRTRSRLLAAVVKVCSAPGQPGHAVIDDVLNAADVSRGTFYNHFASLEEALDIVGRELADEMTVGLMPVYNVLPEPLDRTAAGLQLFLRRGAVDPVWGRFVSHTDHLFDDAELIAAISADLRNGRACGAYGFSSVETATDFVVGSTMGGIRRFVRGGVGLAQVFDLATMILRGLGADPAKAGPAIHRTDLHLRANAPGLLPWWRDMPDAEPGQPRSGDHDPAPHRQSGKRLPLATTPQQHGGTDEPSP